MYAIAASKEDDQKALIGAGADLSFLLAGAQAICIWSACCGEGNNTDPEKEES